MSAGEIDIAEDGAPLRPFRLSAFSVVVYANRIRDSLGV